MINQLKLTEKQLQLIYNDIKKTLSNCPEYIHEWYTNDNDIYINDYTDNNNVSSIRNTNDTSTEYNTITEWYF